MGGAALRAVRYVIYLLFRTCPHKSFLQALTTLTNGILQDPRVFYMENPQNWMKMCDQQGVILCPPQ